MFIKLTDADDNGDLFVNIDLIETIWRKDHHTKLVPIGSGRSVYTGRSVYKCKENPEEIMQLIKEAQKCLLN